MPAQQYGQYALQADGSVIWVPMVGNRPVGPAAATPKPPIGTSFCYACGVRGHFVKDGACLPGAVAAFQAGKAAKPGVPGQLALPPPPGGN